jgi:16S rRNA (uracil1498-N3)-methyltransferase
MHRFYCDNLPRISESDGFLSDEPPILATLGELETHHARRVLRLELRQEVELFDGRGGVGRGLLESWSPGQVRLTRLRQVPAPTPALEMAVAIPKGPRAEEMVNQLSQVGVDRLIPLQTRRGVVDPRPQKLDKFARVAIESAKQSGRAHLMSVAPRATLGEVLAGAYDLRFIAAPGRPPCEKAGPKLEAARRVLILVGPEGGWTEEELEAARAAGCLPWVLGPNILRIETAAVAAAAIVMSRAAFDSKSKIENPTSS